MNTYCILIQGQVALGELNPMSPHQMTLLQTEPAATRISIHTDQAGLLGMLRHLHNLGFTLLSVACQPDVMPAKNERKEP